MASISPATLGSDFEESALDVLSDVLGLLRLRGQVLCKTEVSAPWGLGFTSADAHFHVFESGSCYLQTADDEKPIKVSAGDLVLLPQARGHRLFDSPGTPILPMKVVNETRQDQGHLRVGGGGAETRFLCGRFRFDPRLAASVLSGLPAVIHVPGTAGKPVEWLELAVRFLTAEAKSTAPGRSIAMSRLMDLLFVEGVRYWLSNCKERPLGWIGALRDPRIGTALVRMHAEPDRAWDVEGLAAQAGMSRSAFAQRFVELVGEPPSKYLTRWRVYLAARLLKAPGATIAQTAEQVGYESEAAFSRVFKRYMQVAPAAFRDGRPRRPAVAVNRRELV